MMRTSRSVRRRLGGIVVLALLLAGGFPVAYDQALAARTVPRPSSAATFSQGTSPIQPGAFVATPVGGCTMNFIFQDKKGKLYVGTAGHCFEKVGDRARAEPNPGSALSTLDRLFDFGSAVFIEFDEDNPSIDFALIRIDRDHYNKVNPAMRFWGGPTGVTSAPETRAGDLLLAYGYGLGFDVTPVTRPRTRVLVDDDATHYTSQSASMFGDSGSPITHRATGKALGIDSRFNLVDVPPTTDAGPTVEHILRRLTAVGWRLRIVTAPYRVS